ncbi:MAG TPA: hypothetical protein VJ882_05545 [Desulfuromonadales bacterium]|nr:hypothetical protein [Desulfuromonadales bacterium]
MSDVVKKKDDEKKVLSHEPEPGYRTAFWIIFSLSVLYLAIIFFFSTH